MIQTLGVVKEISQPVSKGSRKILPDKDLDAAEFLNGQLVKDLVEAKNDIRTNPSVRKTFEKVKQSERDTVIKNAGQIAELLEGQVPDDTLKQIAFNIKWIVAGALNVGSISAALQIINK